MPPSWRLEIGFGARRNFDNLPNHEPDGLGHGRRGFAENASAADGWIRMDYEITQIGRCFGMVLSLLGSLVLGALFWEPCSGSLVLGAVALIIAF